MKNLCQIIQLFVFLLIYCGELGSCIECYECVHNRQKVKRRHRYVFPCTEFDGSERFIVRCPDSDYCVYQSISLKLASETITVKTMDGCTPNATDKRRLNEAWLAADGCTSVGESFSPSSVLYCFCPFSFCNDSISIHSRTKSLYAISIFLALGYLTKLLVI